MRMTCSQFIKNETDAQNKQIEIETIQQALEKELSSYGYVADDKDKFMLNELISEVVRKSKITRGFRLMSLDEYDKANRTD